MTNFPISDLSRVPVISFSAEELRDPASCYREWVLTNGLGGYSGSSVTGAHNRTHQGYLIASLHPPTERRLVFSKTNERILFPGGEVCNLTLSRYKGGIQSGGLSYLKGFCRDSSVHYYYEASGISLEKQIVPVHGANGVAVGYFLENHSGKEASLAVTPLMNFREHSASSRKESLRFQAIKQAHGFDLIPAARPDLKICLRCSEGLLLEREDRYDEDMELQTEVDNETAGLDSHFTPFDLLFSLPEGARKEISLTVCICSAGGPAASCPRDDSALFPPEELLHPRSFTVRELAGKESRRLEGILSAAGFEDPLARMLVQAADAFPALRSSTASSTILAGLPWFTDWGRDTMIAFTGLMLTTKRFSQAWEILETFAAYEKDGLIPNMFPDDGQDPLYNTADASLWYFYAVYQYLAYVPGKDTLDRIRLRIYPVLRRILTAYSSGTAFSIGMQEDGLMAAGSGLDQVTWMDVRVGDWVATPRHGKPVEINALWYNALRVMDLLENEMKELQPHLAGLTLPFRGSLLSCRELASQVKSSFCREFWNEKDRCLYDVISLSEGPDATIRPNQIYAVSLPFRMLSPDQEAAVVDLVYRKLYAGTGLRSLDPEDPRYHPVYLGSLDKRDHAYHQGTSWGFLLGAFLTAWARVQGHTPQAARQAAEFLLPVRAALRDNGIGTLSEIYDGDAPHLGRGCYAQAWSVGELLRAYAEDILPLLS